LLSGDFRLVERRGVDQITNCFSLRKIEAAVQVSAEGELSGLG